MLAVPAAQACAPSALLERAAMTSLVERVVSGAEIRQWKLRRDIYLHTPEDPGVPAGRLALGVAAALARL